MDPTKKFYQQVNQREEEQRRQASREKWKTREKNFWKTFLFAENGKPKSALLIYTFCLSFVFLAFYLLSFGILIDVLQPLVRHFPVFVGNLTTSVLCSVVALLPCWLVHHVSKDKRLTFGGHLWLGLYAVAVLVTEIILLWGDWAAILQFLCFFAWFFLLPVLIGLAGTFLLYKKDQKKAPEPEPEWKKYITRR